MALVTPNLYMFVMTYQEKILKQVKMKFLNENYLYYFSSLTSAQFLLGYTISIFYYNCSFDVVWCTF